MYKIVEQKQPETDDAISNKIEPSHISECFSDRFSGGYTLTYNPSPIKNISKKFEFNYKHSLFVNGGGFYFLSNYEGREILVQWWDGSVDGIYFVDVEKMKFFPQKSKSQLDLIKGVEEMHCMKIREDITKALNGHIEKAPTNRKIM